MHFLIPMRTNTGGQSSKSNRVSTVVTNTFVVNRIPSQRLNHVKHGLTVVFNSDQRTDTQPDSAYLIKDTTSTSHKLSHVGCLGFCQLWASPGVVSSFITILAAASGAFSSLHLYRFSAVSPLPCAPSVLSMPVALFALAIGDLGFGTLFQVACFLRACPGIVS